MTPPSYSSIEDSSNDSPPIQRITDDSTLSENGSNTKPNEPVLGGGASIQSAIVNLLNTIVGAGILAMPFAIKQNGILLGSFLILFSGSAAGLGLYFQGLCSTFLPPGKASFFQLAQITYPSLSVIFDIAIAIKCFGVGVSYLIIIADIMPQISEYFNTSYELLQSRVFWVVISM